MARHAAPEQQTQPPVLVEHATHAYVPDAEYSQRARADSVYQPQPTSDQIHAETSERVRAVREWMQGLPREPRRKLEGYIRQFYDDRDRPVGRHGSHIDWLADETRGATAEDVLVWVERQAFEIQAQQEDPAVQKRITEVREFTAENYDYYRDKEWFAKTGTVSKPAETMQNTHVFVGDIRDTTIWSILGYHRHGSDYVVVAQGHTGTTEERTAGLLREMDETLPHELLHAAGVGDFLPSWAEEAMVEHATDAFANGQMSILHPDYRQTANRVYLSERRLLGVLQMCGAKQIDTRIITKALTSSGYDSPEFQALDEQLQESWKEWGKFKRVSNQMAAIEQELAVEHETWSDLKIQAEASKRMAEILIQEGKAIRRMQELGKRATARPQRAVGVARVPAPRGPSPLS